MNCLGILKFIFLLVVLSLVSCDYSVRDVLEPALPEYSEEGRDISGCLMNEMVWRDLPLLQFFGPVLRMRVIYDTLHQKSRIVIPGYLIMGEDERTVINVYFDLNNTVIKDLEDFQSYRDAELKIDGQEALAGLDPAYFGVSDCTGNKTFTGNLFIRHLTAPLSTDEPGSVIVAGTFGFSIFSDCGQLDVFNGRFDYNLSEDSMEPGLL